MYFLRTKQFSPFSGTHGISFLLRIPFALQLRVMKILYYPSNFLNSPLTGYITTFFFPWRNGDYRDHQGLRHFICAFFPVKVSGR